MVIDAAIALLAYLDDILDVLSCIEPHYGEPMDNLSHEIRDECMKLSSAIMVLLQWDNARRDMVGLLREHGVAVKVLLVAEEGRTPRGLPEYVEIVSGQSIREGTCLKL